MSATENLLPPHGRIPCTACFGGQATWGRSVAISDDGWTLDNNPCAWGSRDPRYLLLGFSKGVRQTAGISSRPHDGIPYDGFRPRLTDGLRMLGLLTPTDTIDAHIRADEPDWGFGSFVRCTLAKDGRKSGSIIPASARAGRHDAWIDTCSRLYLSRLPPRLEIVVMLSNEDSYVQACFERIKAIHPGTKRMNDVAYGDARVTWVHIVHFGGQGFNHMRDWLARAGNKAGQKGKSAAEAVQMARGRSPGRGGLTR